MEPGIPLEQIPWLRIGQTLLESKKTHYSVSHHCSYQANLFHGLDLELFLPNG